MARNNKGKGSNAERELLHKFWKVDGWGAIRVAGSGSMKYPSSDLVVGNGSRLLVIECKSCGSDKEYISKDQIEQLNVIAKRLGGEPWVGIRFDRSSWLFLAPNELKETGNHWVAVKVLAEAVGRGFNELVAAKDL